MTSLMGTWRAVVIAGIGAAVLSLPSNIGAQTTTDPRLEPGQPGFPEQGTTDAGSRTATPRSDQAIAEQQRLAAERERAVRYRDDHRHHGETYVAGYGGITFGSTTANMEGRGSALGAPIDNPSLANSAVYGVKFGYFHPGRLNWLGLEVEGFNSTPHMRESGGLPGSHLRLTTLAFNVIARTKLACRDRRDDHAPRPTPGERATTGRSSD